MSSRLPPHVGKKLTLNGWFAEDGRGNSTKLAPKIITQRVPMLTSPQPIEPAWKPSEPLYKLDFNIFS